MQSATKRTLTVIGICGALLVLLLLSFGRIDSTPASPSREAAEAVQTGLVEVARAQSPTITNTISLPVVYGPPESITVAVTAHDGAQFYAGGETWEAARNGADLYLFGPNNTSIKANEQAPNSGLAIYTFGRAIAYFDTSELAGTPEGRVAGELTLTYYNDPTRQQTDISFDNLFRRADAPPAEKEMWHRFDDWPLLASQPVTTTLSTTRTVTLDADQIVEADGTLPDQVAIGIQISEPRLDYGEALFSTFWLDRMALRVSVRPEETR